MRETIEIVMCDFCKKPIDMEPVDKKMRFTTYVAQVITTNDSTKPYVVGGGGSESHRTEYNNICEDYSGEICSLLDYLKRGGQFLPKPLEESEE
jgi:hypothetical protein